mgnify:CR=1 FL=1
MVDENIFGFVWQSFEVIKVIFTSIKISFGGATVNLLQFSLGIIVFGVVMGLFINYTKKQSASDSVNAYDRWQSKRKKGD